MKEVYVGTEFNGDGTVDMVRLSAPTPGAQTLYDLELRLAVYGVPADQARLILTDASKIGYRNAELDRSMTLAFGEPDDGS